MCGICGIYDKGFGRISSEKIVAMRDIMINRGPDDAGLFIAPHIGLGHRRLSIIDLSAAGHQPLSNEDRTIWIVFNGEIYNFPELKDDLVERGHVFRSGTDTEVLIHGYEEWGIECLLERINGMYAFAIWNSESEELILVRDRLGIKPLYYMEANGRVLFSSDIKSLYSGHDGELTMNYEAIDNFLHSYCIPQEFSIFREIRKVLPAHYIIFSAKKRETRKYWDLSFLIKENRSEDELMEELELRLTKAVRQRMVSDVPLGAFLSGGVDSSLVVAFMAMHSDRPIKTFSIGVEKESYNELKYARKVAEKYSTEHREFIVEPDALNILPEIVWSYGEPFADSSQIPTYCVAKMTREYVTVALTGDGGDESFAGYSNYAAHYFGSLYRKYVPAWLSNKLLWPLSDSFISLAGRRGVFGKFKTLIEYGSGNIEDCFKAGGIFRYDHKEGLYSPEFKRRLLDQSPADIYKKYLQDADGMDEVDKALYIDIKTQLPNDYLTKVDVATMMNSLEARSPFLDYELMEFAARIPSKVKLKYGRQKYLLKRFASGYLPQEVVYRKKWGFGIPIGFWFKDTFEPLLRAVLLSEAARQRGYFRTAFVETLLNEHMSGRDDHTHRLWALLCLELWHLMFMDKVITPRTELVV